MKKIKAFDKTIPMRYMVGRILDQTKGVDSYYSWSYESGETFVKDPGFANNLSRTAAYSVMARLNDEITEVEDTTYKLVPDPIGTCERYFQKHYSELSEGWTPEGRRIA